jgi:hypothetical protein
VPHGHTVNLKEGQICKDPILVSNLLKVTVIRVCPKRGTVKDYTM